MLVRVTCGGVVIGTADFDPPRGVAHAPLSPTPAYVHAASSAQLLGRRFACTQFWLPPNGDFADVAAAEWDGERLALEDMAGSEISVGNVVVVEGLTSVDGESTVRVVADFRWDPADVEARISPGGPSGENRTRRSA
jgi:hypothetical protein